MADPLMFVVLAVLIVAFFLGVRYLLANPESKVRPGDHQVKDERQKLEEDIEQQTENISARMRADRERKR